MGVVESAGKLRLICNDRYLNLFLKPIPFRYEKLRDILSFTPGDGFMATADLKSGYFHVPIHPAFWKYFAFKVFGRVFFNKVLCFGFAQACFVFTKVMQEPLLEIRNLGVPISGYIDDSYTASPSYGRTLNQILFTVRTLAALGAFFGLPKCQLKPVNALKWLGFVVDACQKRFALPEKRLFKIEKSLRELALSPETSARNLAKVAGLLASTAPAVLPVALYSRSLYEALSGKEGWDTLFPSPREVKETAKFWIANLRRFNGRRWWPRNVAVTVEVDASEVGYGGFAITPKGAKLELAGTFNQTESETSSTEREVRGYVAAIELVGQEAPREIKDSSLSW